MQKSSIVLSTLTGLTLSWSALATELTPLQGGTFVVGDHVASVYYTERDRVYDVVTTIAPDAERGGAPIRVVSSLSFGEKQTVSVGAYGTSVSAEALELVHDGDRLVVTVAGEQVAAR